jgi:hypothetical protein
LGRWSLATCPEESQLTPNQEQVEVEIDQEDSELAAIKVDFHRSSASASGLIALDVHTSRKIEIHESLCSTIAGRCLLMVLVGKW